MAETGMDGIHPDEWNRLIASLEGAHILQTWEWGEVKSGFGWEPEHCLWVEAGGKIQLLERPSTVQLAEAADRVVAAALVLQRSQNLKGIRLPVRVLYVPKGPLLRSWDDEYLRRCILGELGRIARNAGALFIKIDPDVPVGYGVPDTKFSQDNPTGTSAVADLESYGWKFSEEQIQFRNTVLIDLNSPEEHLLERMKQKTRYNIRLAGRKGVKVRRGSAEDLDLLYRMYMETADRDGFVLREASYYHAVWSRFISAGMAKPLIAEVDGAPAAAVILFTFGRKAWYLYGMSADLHREKMPNYLLQWEAMRLARENGCAVYDLWGAPDDFNGQDPLSGVYRFKEGLGGQIVRHIGAWDLPVYPALYKLYTSALPRILDWMRLRGQQRIRRELGA